MALRRLPGLDALVRARFVVSVAVFVVVDDLVAAAGRERGKRRAARGRDERDRGKSGEEELRVHSQNVGVSRSLGGFCELVWVGVGCAVFALTVGASAIETVPLIERSTSLSRGV